MATIGLKSHNEAANNNFDSLFVNLKAKTGINERNYTSAYEVGKEGRIRNEIYTSMYRNDLIGEKTSKEIPNILLNIFTKSDKPKIKEILVKLDKLV